jgi:hypothetical protein
MRRLAIPGLLIIALAGCGGSGSEESNAATEAEMLDENTINSLLGADIPPEAYPGAGGPTDNELNAIANSDEPDGNQSKASREEP